MDTSHRDFAKREIRFELSAFGGRRVVIFGGDRYLRDLLTPVTFYR